MTTVGFVKDAIASCMFLTAVMIIHRAPLDIIRWALLMGAYVDALFTLYPEWHCQKWNPVSAPGAVLGAQIGVFGFLLLQCK